MKPAVSPDANRNDTARHRAGLGGLYALAALAAVFAVAGMDVDLVRCTIRQVRSADYPAADGVIVHNRPSPPGSNHDDWLYDIRYRYEVAGRPYEGRVYRHAANEARFGWHLGTDERFPIGRPVTVYYNPADPADAVLLPGVGGHELVTALALVYLNAPLVLLGYGAWLSVRPPRPDPVPARLRRDGSVTRVRVTHHSPAVFAALAFTLWCAFVSAPFLLARGYEYYPPAWVGVLAWCIALVPVPFAWAAARRYARSPRRDLVVDDRRRVLVLPCTHGREDEVTLPRDAVRGVTLAARRRRPAGAAPRAGDRTEYFVCLEWDDQSGNGRRRRRRRAVLERERDPDDAARIADWLGDFLAVPCRRRGNPGTTESSEADVLKPNAMGGYTAVGAGTGAA